MATPPMGEKAATIFGDIAKWHKQYEADVDLDQFRDFFYLEHPTLSQSQKGAYDELFLELKAAEPLNKEFVKDAIRALYKREKARQIADHALRVLNGDVDDFGAISTILEENSPDEVDEIKPVSSELEDVLDGVKDTSKWKFNLKPLYDIVPGIGPGNAYFIFARTELGKTAWWVSSAYAPGGFIHQGAKVLAVCNEEPAIRTQARGICACVAQPIDVIHADRAAFRDRLQPIRDHIKLYDALDWSIDDVERKVKEHKPDILIIDQLDKIKIDGSFAREDQMLSSLYERFRTILKKYNVAGIGLSQASADAEGQDNLTLSMMANARTGKAAEGDLVIGLGYNPIHNPLYRKVNILKNKLSGKHGKFGVMLNGAISTFTA